MVIDNKLNLTVRRYWDLDFTPNYSVEEDDWIEGLREKLLNAVKIRLISDVPLGAFLSGGVDSSAVVALMSQVMDQPVKTFSIGFEEKEFSEVKYARMVAQRFSTDHHEMIVRPDAIELLPKLVWEFDEPVADSSAIPTYFVSKMASEHVTVVFSGGGVWGVLHGGVSLDGGIGVAGTMRLFGDSLGSTAIVVSQTRRAVEQLRNTDREILATLEAIEETVRTIDRRTCIA